MKYNNTHYLEMPREIFKDEYIFDLSVQAKWLFCVMKELEHKYSNEKGMFYRSNEGLARDSGMPLSTVKRAKKELVEVGWIRQSYVHWVKAETGEKSKKHVCAYYILI